MMTAVAELCGHRWLEEEGIPAHDARRHHCERPTRHEDDMLLRQPQQCRCRCGATTTRPNEGATR